MERLALKLCEAVEHEDSKEVGSLLKCGADPNFVLPNGIAAIHLASGKESEFALKCLTMLLQHDGDPNVRSTDDLTPVHVAASWGCCKALIILLWKGGDPFIQDQDGSTALDLAIKENNRRCVVAIQEYKRISGCTDDINEESCITLLLESTCPLSSTKIFPMMSFSKTVTLGNHKTNEVISSQKMPVLCAKNESTEEQEMRYTKTIKDNCPLKPAEVQVPFTRTSQSDYCNEYFASLGESDMMLENSTMGKKNNCDVFIKICPLLDCENSCRNSVNKAVTLDTLLPSYTDSILQQHLKCYRDLSLNRDGTDFQVFRKLEEVDVTSPDPNYTYTNDHSEEKKKNTRITSGNVCDTENLEEPETDSRNNYRDCNTSLWCTSDRRWVVDRIYNSSQDSNGNGICIQSKNNIRILSNKPTSKTMNAQSSRLVATLKEMQAGANEELTGTCLQISSGRNGISTVECINKTVRTSEMQPASQSSTVPVEATNYEHDSQDLQIQLKNLLLSTKGCHRTCSEANGVTKSLQCDRSFNENMKNVSFSSTSSEDDFSVGAHGPHVTEKVGSELQEDLETTLLTTKNSHSLSMNEYKSPFFTPRTKSRLNSFKFRQNTSLLFDDSVKKAKLGSRMRSSDDLLASSTINPSEQFSAMSSKSSGVKYEWIKMSNTFEILNNTIEKSLKSNSTDKILHDHKENISEPKTTLCMSNFISDYYSKTDQKSCLQLTQETSNHWFDDGISMWLTEDGESETSDVADHGIKIGSVIEEKSGHVSLSNKSFLHSTLVENIAVNSCKAPLYNLGRLSCILKDGESTLQSCPNPVHEFFKQEGQLSPGGCLENVGHVENLYRDNEKGHALIEKHIPCIDQSGTSAAGKSPNAIIYDWKNYKINSVTTNKAPSRSSPNRVAVELYRLSNDDITSQLKELGVDCGQITSQNRKMCVVLLDTHLKEQASNGPSGLYFDYSPELSLALHTFNIPDCNKDEAELSREFDQPDKSQKWREGVLKASFNYLLLDPRVTRNLPSRCHVMSQLDCLRTFVCAVFYVGKGKQSRPYSHLYEALNHYTDNCK
ncbi:Ankyrin repeat and LEM, partial [Pristimantis euphronides]